LILGNKEDVKVEKQAPITPVVGSVLRMNTELVRLLRDSFDETTDDDGWAALSRLASAVSKRYPEFDTRTYGYAKFKGFLQVIAIFELEERPTLNGGAQVFAKKSPPKSKPRK
jgi:hypothetical protein